MTTRANARIAGAAFLIYIAAGIASMVVSRGTGAEDMAGRIADVPANLAELRVVVLLTILCAFCAIALGVTLRALTRDADPDLALVGFGCRLGEGLVAISPGSTLALMWLGTATGAPDGESAATIARFLAREDHMKSLSAALLFAAGSTAFAFAFLRGRFVPRVLAQLGVVASLILLVALPLQIVGLVGGPAAYAVMWLPMLVFELWLAVWLIARGGMNATPEPAWRA